MPKVTPSKYFLLMCRFKATSLFYLKVKMIAIRGQVVWGSEMGAKL